MKYKSFFIYSTNFQLNLLSNCIQIYLDGTFKSCPKNFYQLLSIHGFIGLTKKNILLIFILLTSKTTEIYTRVFREIKNILENKKLSLYLEIIQTDFEKGLLKAYKKIFGEKIKLQGRCFHYLKALYAYLKKVKILKKRYKLLNNYLINILRYFPFIEENIRIQFFNIFRPQFIFSITEFDIDKVDVENYTFFINYYSKNWIHYNQVWTDNKLEINFTRTNNPCEIFHKYLNSLIR